MSIFDGARLRGETFKLDSERMRRGWYSDKYFANIVTLLSALSAEGYAFGEAETGDIEVEMQWFTRRRPFSVVVGVDKALAMLQACTGYFDDAGVWIPTYRDLAVTAVHDGFQAPYGGDPNDITPVLKVRGRYRDFALLETPTLGALTRGTRVATNVYDVLSAARGKEVLFFPARFDAHEVQAADGYAYHIAVKLFNQTHGHAVQSAVSTDEQGTGGAGRAAARSRMPRLRVFSAIPPKPCCNLRGFCRRRCRALRWWTSTTTASGTAWRRWKRCSKSTWR